MPIITVKEGPAISYAPGHNLLQLLADAGHPLEGPCSGRGTCGKCMVRHTGGALPAASPAELRFLTAAQQEAGFRLACFVYPAADAEIEVLQRTEADILLGDKAAAIGIVNNVDTPHKENQHMGVAIDIGTTTVAASLLCLPGGDVLAQQAAINPQTRYGLDVLSRISHTMEHPETGTGCLKAAIVDCLNEMLDALCRTAGYSKESVKEIAVAGNTTMLHLLLGVNPVSLGVAPYRPAFVKAQKLPASKIGLSAAPDCCLYCIPSVSAFVGADIVSGVYTAQLARKAGNTLFLDIGTNGEMVLASSGRMLACACAAGPALEGMNISCGARAAQGVIEDVEILDGKVKLHTIGGAGATGICGSGVLAVVCALLRCGLLLKNGRLVKPEDLPTDDARRKLLFREGKTIGILLNKKPRIVFTQKDIRQVQLAKGAILSGVTALIKRTGLHVSELDEVLVAGQFGSHLKSSCLVDAGLLPRECKDKIWYVGNASHTGTQLALTHSSAKHDMEALASQIEYFELSTLEGYEKTFQECLLFETPPARGEPHAGVVAL